MQDKTTLTITSLLSILLFTFHWADDIVRGFAPGGVSALAGVGILVVWLCGTLVLRGRVGLIIILLGSALGVTGLVLHLRGAGLVGGRVAHSDGMLFWVWTLLAVGVSSAFSFILSALALWASFRVPR